MFSRNRRGLVLTGALVAAALAISACGGSSGSAPTSGDATSASDDPFTPVIARVLSTPRPVPATDGLVHIA